MLDIGILGAMSELDAGSLLDGNRLFVEFKGALAEQYVRQQLLCETQYTPYYYGTQKSTFEQDFLLQIGMDAVPVEVKAEGNINSQSLKVFRDKFAPKKSVRLSLLPYKDQGWLCNVPLYAVCNLDGLQILDYRGHSFFKPEIVSLSGLLFNNLISSSESFLYDHLLRS